MNHAFNPAANCAYTYLESPRFGPVVAITTVRQVSCYIIMCFYIIMLYCYIISNRQVASMFTLYASVAIIRKVVEYSLLCMWAKSGSCFNYSRPYLEEWVLGKMTMIAGVSRRGTDRRL